MRLKIYLDGLQMSIICGMIRMSDKEMAPQVLEHPGARPIRRKLMDTSKSSAFRAYVLVRVQPSR
jgi:hypothetical protein